VRTSKLIVDRFPGIDTTVYRGSRAASLTSLMILYKVIDLFLSLAVYPAVFTYNKW